MNDVYPILAAFREQVKLFHFQTPHYGHHRACDKFVTTFDELIDKFMEEYQGKEGTRVHIHVSSIPLKNIKNAKEMTRKAKQIKTQLKKLNLEFDLANIRDEMVGAIHQFQYLLTFF